MYTNIKIFSSKRITIISLILTIYFFISCQPDIDKITLNQTNLELNVNETFQLKAVNEPKKASQIVEWVSSKPNIAVVNDNGLVKAISPGECEIKAIANDKEAICKVFINSKTFKVNEVEFKMITVEGGTFIMGTNSDEAFEDEKIPHEVTLSTYYIGETEVTQALWNAVMGNIPTQINTSVSDLKGENRPIFFVSWNDICNTNGFLDKLNTILADKLPIGYSFALPTEAQWEYAARGGKYSQNYKYSGSDNIDEVAWYINNTGGKGSKDVKTKMPNELGIYDMSGNAGEWCYDWYHPYYYHNSEKVDPTGPDEGSDRTNRNGGFRAKATGCAVWSRFYDPPTTADDFISFRLALVKSK